MYLPKETVIEYWPKGFVSGLRPKLPMECAIVFEEGQARAVEKPMANHSTSAKKTCWEDDHMNRIWGISGMANDHLGHG